MNKVADFRASHEAEETFFPILHVVPPDNLVIFQRAIFNVSTDYLLGRSDNPARL